jgi:hypothetical protein
MAFWISARLRSDVKRAEDALDGVHGPLQFLFRIEQDPNGVGAKDRVPRARSLLAQINVYRWWERCLWTPRVLRNQERVTRRLAGRANRVTAI